MFFDRRNFVFDEDSVWGRVDLVWCGDDAQQSYVGSCFKISADTLAIETFMVPAYAARSVISPKREAVLYESINYGAGEDEDSLFLYVHNLRTGEETPVVSYFDESVREFIRSIPHDIPGAAQRYPFGRGLQPEWIDERTIMYVDFETRERTIVDIHTLEKKVDDTPKITDEENAQQEQEYVVSYLREYIADIAEAQTSTELVGDRSFARFYPSNLVLAPFSAREEGLCYLLGRYTIENGMVSVGRIGEWKVFSY